METIVEPKPPAAPPIQQNESIQNGNSELNSIFSQSKETIQKQKLIPPKIKGSAGRKALPRDENGNKIRPGDPRFEAAKAKMQAESPQNPQTNGQAAAPAQPAPDIKQFLIDPIIAVSNIPANKHQIPELGFNRAEAEACANAIQNVIDAFIPDWSKMDPKTASILSAALVVSSIGIGKMQIYAAVMEARQKAEKKAAENNNGMAEIEVIKANPGPNLNGKKPASGLFKE